MSKKMNDILKSLYNSKSTRIYEEKRFQRNDLFGGRILEIVRWDII